MGHHPNKLLKRVRMLKSVSKKVLVVSLIGAICLICILYYIDERYASKILVSLDSSGKDLSKSKTNMKSMHVDFSMEHGFTPWLKRSENRDTSLAASKRRNYTLMQHIPKSGGTSLCNLYKKQPNNNIFMKAIKKTKELPRHDRLELNGIDQNCWRYIDGPLHFLRLKLKNLQCKERKEVLTANFPELTFSMQERFMDSSADRLRTLFCPDIKYGIVIREPLMRAASHVHFFVQRHANNKQFEWWPFSNSTPSQQVVKDILDVKKGIMWNTSSYIQKVKRKTMMSYWQTKNLYYLTNNYLFRYLLGTQLMPKDHTGELQFVIPSINLDDIGDLSQKIDEAKQALTQFDFILLSKDMAKKCSRNILKTYMNFTILDLPKGREHKSTPVIDKKRKELALLLKPWNLFDVELYKFAVNLATKQCLAYS